MQIYLSPGSLACIVAWLGPRHSESTVPGMQSAQPSASILQSVLAWQQQRRAATKPQTVRAASLQAGGSQHRLGMQHPQPIFAAAPPLQQRQAGGGSGGLMPPWMLPAPQLSSVAPVTHFPPPIAAVSAAYAGHLLSAPHPSGSEQLPRWQPDLAGDPAQTAAALQPGVAAFWQGLPRTPQPCVGAPLLQGAFEAFRLPALAAGASAFTPGFPPLPAALQRRHTWSSVTAPPPNHAADATNAAPMAGLALHQPIGLGVWPAQHMRDQVTPRSRRHLPWLSRGSDPYLAFCTQLCRATAASAVCL